MSSGPNVSHPADAEAASYGPEYYASHCGPVPYARTQHWLDFFGLVADHLLRAFAPAKIFDAGCAMGLLVECFWDRGVEAHGRDISAWAIGQCRPDIRPFCHIGSIADPIEGHYDLVTCIEVLEHIPQEAALRAIAAISAATNRVLFSSSPVDFDEPTHCTIRPTAYWLARWAEAGFAPVPGHDAGYLAPHAFVLERAETGRTPLELAAFADHVRLRIALADARMALGEAGETLAAERAAAERSRAAIAGREQQERRARAIGARRERDAQAEAIQAREVAEAASREAEMLRTALAAASAAAASASAKAATLEAAEEARQQTELRARRAEAERDIILRSTAWRATRPLRAAAALIGPVARRRARRAAAAAVWTLTGQLSARLRRRRQILRDMHEVAGSDLFDPAWYAHQNPDVALSGLPPAYHYAASGAGEGRDPGPRFSAARYHEAHPEAAASPRPALLHYLEHGKHQGWPLPAEGAVAAPVAGAADPVPPAPKPPMPEPAAPLAAFDLLLRQAFPRLQPLPTYAAVHDVPRVTVITDSIAPDSLFGGVATSLILAALLATRLNGALRLVTRAAPADAGRIASTLAAHGIAWQGNVDLIHAPPGSGEMVPMAEHDLCLTTSWWTTRSVRGAVDPARIVYLLQEDERGFYPLGDDHLRCSEMLADTDLCYVINSELLRQHLAAEGLAPGGIAFEPAFPTAAPFEPHLGTLKNFFFYARLTHHPRNLFWRGLEVLGAAIDARILDPGEWDFYAVGNAADIVQLPGGAQLHAFPSLPWTDYASLIRRMDLGLSLMHTPHPSYPPIDLAAAGAVVVTNRFGVKQCLQNYSKNILCVQPTVSGLLDGLRDGAALCADPEARLANFQSNHLHRNWETALAPVLDHLATRFGREAPVHP
jgi:hypothetical protein